MHQTNSILCIPISLFHSAAQTASVVVHLTSIESLEYIENNTISVVETVQELIEKHAIC